MYLQQIIRAADETCEDMVPDSKLFSKREALLQQVTEQNSFDSAFELVKISCGRNFPDAFRCQQFQRTAPGKTCPGLYSEELYGSGFKPEQYLFLSEYQYQLFQYDF